ncbi:hypothetical protein AK88_03575 [Plasmodium fragile]|uniref:Uncharacterized protein n=1 Tax=Plasmodium fragile TaxID=5857 RepID=A0A0D9QM04_PLAFR|nr:uncharacterized protein AK88_03575 [Plasmodium fragile]KJP86761.1 hypothetical protein AK88_03575 [Plasmodium fragile]
MLSGVQVQLGKNGIFLLNNLCEGLHLSMRDEPLRPPFCATSAHSEAKRRTLTYTYEDFKMENEIFFNSHGKMSNIYNNILGGRNYFDGTDAIDNESRDRGSSTHSKWRAGASASTCRDGEELLQRGDEYARPSVESNQEKTYRRPLREEETSSLLHYTSRYSSMWLYSTHQRVHGTSFTREHTKCTIQKRRRTLERCKTFKMNKRYTNYDPRVHKKKHNSVCLKRKNKKEVPRGTITGQLNKRDITLFADHPLKNLSNFENFSPSIHAYCRGESAHMVLHREEEHLEQVLPSEDTLDKHNKDKYLQYISHTIKRQESKTSCFEKNADRILDLVELVLYNRMKEAFFLKEKICDRDRYKELCPHVFFFNNDDDLIETMDRKCQFLPKVPAKENLTTYLGPSPSSIFGHHYYMYKYFFKLVKVHIKLYTWPEPYDANNTVQNKSLKNVNCSDLLYSYKKGMDFPCGNDIRRATKVDKEAKRKKKKKNLFPSLQPLPTREDKGEMKHTEYITVNKIAPDLIYLLNYKNVTLR